MVLLGRLLGNNGASCHVIRNLDALKDMPRIASYNIKDYPGAKPKKKRRGRGPGSHRGKTSGRGHKGQGQRGTRPYFQFEGGQTPFYRLVPKHGSAGPSNNKREYQPLNLDKLQYFIDSGRIDPNETITMKVMKLSGVVQGTIVDGVKLLGMGADWFESKVNIEVSMATPSAIEAVERQGGKITAVYFDKVGMRYHLKIKEPKLPVPRLARPPAKLMQFYADPVNRGFLADENEVEKLRHENRIKADKVAKQLEKLNVSQE